MNIAMVGLGRMGLNMARRLARGGVAVTAYNRTVQKTHDFAAEEGGAARAVDSIPDLVAALPTPRFPPAPVDPAARPDSAGPHPFPCDTGFPPLTPRSRGPHPVSGSCIARRAAE